MFLCTRAAAPLMMQQRYRQDREHLVRKRARERHWSALYEGAAPYSTAEAGRARLHPRCGAGARRVRHQRERRGAPGPGPTPSASGRLHLLNETVEYSPNKMTPLGRLAYLIEIAHAVLFLASDEANYITGHTLPVTGGR